MSKEDDNLDSNTNSNNSAQNEKEEINVEDELAKIKREMAEMKEMMREKRSASYEDIDPDELDDQEHDDYSPDFNVRFNSDEFDVDEGDVGATINEYLQSVFTGLESKMRRSVENIGRQFQNIESDLKKDFAKDLDRDIGREIEREFKQKGREFRKRAKQAQRHVDREMKQASKAARRAARHSKRQARVIHMHELSETELQDFYELTPKIMSALSDARRLEILKILSKRPYTQSDLSNKTGIKGGSFKHHVDGLRDEKFIYQEGARGRYLITQLGVEALKLAEILYKRYKYEKREEEGFVDIEVRSSHDEDEDDSFDDGDEDDSFEDQEESEVQLTYGNDEVDGEENNGEEERGEQNEF